MNEHLLPIPNVKRSLTFFQYVGAVLRAIAAYCDGGSIAPPSTQQLAREELQDLQVKLYVALRQREQAEHVVKYLEARISRLKGASQ